MNISVLDTNFDRYFEVDTYESFIWTEKYNEPGTFELYTTVDKTTLDNLKVGYYLENSESDRLMIIEDYTIETDVEDGNKIKIIGRSLESILDRRIVWSMTTIDGNLQSGVQRLLNNAIISPSDSKRRISNFIFESSTDTSITSLTLECQFTGDSLLEAIESICKDAEIGFKITLDNEKRFVFKLFNGVNRSFDQDVNEYVVFSPRFDNLISSNYKEENSVYKNVALVAGEGEGKNRKTQVAGNTTVTGLDRKELFVDARDISKEDDMSDSKYNKLLKTRGSEKLAENKVNKEFDGQCETRFMYKYNTDFFIGDILQVENEFGITAKSRITEYVWSHNSSGLESYPTFEAILD